MFTSEIFTLTLGLTCVLSTQLKLKNDIIAKYRSLGESQALLARHAPEARVGAA